MLWLILGVALWWAAHFFGRVAPGLRARMGAPGRGIIAAAVLLSVVLMIIGYRMAEGAVFWGRSPALVGLNNLLMIGAFYVYLSAKAAPGLWIARIKHPQLAGVKIWAFAHLLVNGDVESFVLFGGLLAWAVVSVIVINRQDGPWDRPETAPIKSEGKMIAVALLGVAVVMGLHWILGVTPWG